MKVIHILKINKTTQAEVTVELEQNILTVIVISTTTTNTLVEQNIFTVIVISTTTTKTFINRQVKLWLALYEQKQDKHQTLMGYL